MLKLALDSALPLITVYTDDPVNVGAVLTVIADKQVKPYMPTLKQVVKSSNVQYSVWEKGFDWKAAYNKFSSAKATLVVVNPEESYPGAFDAGVMVTPPEMIERFVKKWGVAENHDGLMAALAGLSYEQVFQISKLAMTQYGEYTPRAVRKVRRSLFGTVRGLQMLSTDFFYYDPAPALVNWLEREGRFLTEFDVPMLTPRGLLFNGPPGTGKTMGAKYLARAMDLPLYHLDVASLMEKYVGESENNLRIALKQAENSAPCVMLIDEVEKLFSGTSDDSGVTSRMLSSILWWLQEHNAKVFTIMTTNKETAIPPELYRPGRIDSEVTFTTMNLVDAIAFAHELTSRMEDNMGISFMPPESADFTSGQVSHAEVTQVVTRKAKLAYLKKEG